MAKKVTTPKQTSGGGFSFENKVSAYYAVQMLTAGEAFGAGKGEITRIDFQTRAKGWHLDDILLTLQSNSKQKRIALSIRSNVQFTKTSAPSDFIEAVWEQILHKENDVFDIDTDAMGLITCCQPAPQKDAIQEILNFAKQHNPKELEQNLSVPGYTSKKLHSLFNSFRCPDKLAKLNTKKLGTADMLEVFMCNRIRF